MGRATVRAGVLAWLSPPNVAGINTVFASFPKEIPGQAWMLGQVAGTASGAVAVLFFAGETENRIAIGGQKRIDYTIEVHVFHRSTEVDATVAMAHFDGVFDALKVRLRGSATQPADHTLGGVVWEAAEQRISGEYGEPVLNGELVETWGQLTFVATEMLAPQA